MKIRAVIDFDFPSLKGSTGMCLSHIKVVDDAVVGFTTIVEALWRNVETKYDVSMVEEESEDVEHHK